eukprot:365197-Pyramimonas_sp.AAC.1
MGGKGASSGGAAQVDGRWAPRPSTHQSACPTVKTWSRAPWPHAGSPGPLSMELEVDSIRRETARAAFPPPLTD